MNDKLEVENLNKDNKLSNLYKFLFGGLYTRLFQTVLRSGVCDILDDGKPRSYQELARITNSSEDGMLRLLRYFTYYDLFLEDKTNLGIFSKSEYNHLFTKTSKFYSLAYLWSGDTYYDLYRSIPETFLKSNAETPNTWEILENNENNVLFKDAMYGITVGIIDDILNYVDFSESKTIVDLGGSHGYVVKKILKKYPYMNCINFDLEKVISTIKQSKYHNLKHVSGSFFEEIPVADTYILKLVLHDWPNEDCIKILRNISKYILPNGKVYIFDYIINHEKLDIDALNCDAKLYHLCRGKERTLEDFKYIIDNSGFRIEKVYTEFPSGGIMIKKIEE